MARRGSKKDGGVGAALLFVICGIVAVFKSIAKFVSENIDTVIVVVAALIVCIILCMIIKRNIEKQRKSLLAEILVSLYLEDINDLVKVFDDTIVVKSHQALDNYDDLKYFKENDFESVWALSEKRKEIRKTLASFLKQNEYMKRSQYKWVEEQINYYMEMSEGYKLRVVYITSAGNNRGERHIDISPSRINELSTHPELLMTKGEYNKLLKQQAKEDLEVKKHFLYDRVNGIIDSANNFKEKLIVKSKAKEIDELVQKLFDKTVNSIQKISKLDSDEWGMIEGFIDNTRKQIDQIIENDKRISEYYLSEDFAKIKETCSLLTQSQKEFNEYIEEKAQSITRLFGTRIVRNETENEDVYNYIRAYKKSITPFTAEVSSAVFGSAENSPIDYIVKYFYPNKSQYIEQLEKLRLLIEELETLKEAKVIIDNYKKDYNEYIQDVPSYVMENDEAGFYQRLGLTIIDESVLNIEYRFTYTSGGGMAQRSFAVPMTEENIAELIYKLESKLTQEALAKEQRALMTVKLRNMIKERDNFTCCQCGNSSFKEPNLLLEIDHIIPVSKGGLTQEDNLQTLCWKCNRNKGAKLLY